MFHNRSEKENKKLIELKENIKMNLRILRTKNLHSF